MSVLVHDTEQGPATDERQSIQRFLIDPVVWTRTQIASAVAYNRKAGTPGRYLVVFQDDSGHIAARRVRGSDGLAEGDAFFVTQHANEATNPAVAASGGPGGSGAGASQFLVTYLLDGGDGDDGFLYGQTVKGTHVAAGSQLDGPAVELARPVSSTEGTEVGQGGVSGSAHNGRYAAVWSDSGDADVDDVYGRLYVPYAVYLPLIVSHH
jgi:hypothetical protein